MANLLDDPNFRGEFEGWCSRYLSGDNCQPFIFDWTTQEIAIRYDVKAGEHFFNLNGWASAVSLGSLIAHVNLFAFYKDIGLQIEVFSNFFTDGGFCLRCRLDTNKKFSGDLPKYLTDMDRELLKRAVFDRKTIRDEMNEIEEPQRASVLQALITVWPQSAYISKANLSSKLDTLLQIESIFYRNSKFFSQTFKWIRTSQREYHIRRDGMYIGDLGLNFSEKIMTTFIKNFTNFAAWILRAGAYRQALRVNKMQLSSCDGVILFWSQNKSNLRFIELGKEVTYFLIYLWKLGIGVQPLSLLSQYLNENWEQDSEIFKIKSESNTEVLNYFKGQGINGPVLWGLRIGKLKRSYIATLRRSRDAK